MECFEKKKKTIIRTFTALSPFLANSIEDLSTMVWCHQCNLLIELFLTANHWINSYRMRVIIHRLLTLSAVSQHAIETKHNTALGCDSPSRKNANDAWQFAIKLEISQQQRERNDSEMAVNY